MATSQTTMDLPEPEKGAVPSTKSYTLMLALARALMQMSKVEGFDLEGPSRTSSCLAVFAREWTIATQREHIQVPRVGLPGGPPPT